MEQKQEKKATSIGSLISFPILLIVVTVLPIIFWEELVHVFSVREVVQETVRHLGIWGVLAFIGAQVLQVTFFIIPGNVLQIAAGYLFRLIPGVCYTLAGIAIGTLINYAIGHRLGMPFVKRLVKQDTYRSLASAANSFRTSIFMFIFFLIPGMPKDIAVFAAGATRVRLRTFLLISMIGRTPAVVGSVAIGTSVADDRWLLACIIGAIAILGFACGIIFRKPLQQQFTNGT